MTSPLLLQVQLLLTSVAALLPLAPASARTKVGHILDVAGDALRFIEVGAQGAEDLARKIGAIRGEIEAMIVEGRPVTPMRIDEAMDHVHAASRAFRAAVEQHTGG